MTATRCGSRDRACWRWPRSPSARPVRRTAQPRSSRAPEVASSPAPTISAARAAATECVGHERRRASRRQDRRRGPSGGRRRHRRAIAAHAARSRAGRPEAPRPPRRAPTEARWVEHEAVVAPPAAAPRARRRRGRRRRATGSAGPRGLTARRCAAPRRRWPARHRRGRRLAPARAAARVARPVCANRLRTCGDSWAPRVCAADRAADLARQARAGWPHAPGTARRRRRRSAAAPSPGPSTSTVQGPASASGPDQPAPASKRRSARTTVPAPASAPGDQARAIHDPLAEPLGRRSIDPARRSAQSPSPSRARQVVHERIIVSRVRSALRRRFGSDMATSMRHSR